MVWIQSRREFVGEVDFGEVDVDGIIEDVYNESEDDELCEEIGKEIDVDSGMISEGAECLQDYTLKKHVIQESQSLPTA